MDQARGDQAGVGQTAPGSAPSAEDLATVAAQLGREPRGVLAIAYRTPDRVPAVVTTAPRLPDGTPFPTLFYLTDPRLTAEASRLESAGVMRRMEALLRSDAAVAANYRAAHEAFLAERNAIEDLGTDFSGGGMPDRVKCLHVLIAYALAKGPGTVWLGDEAVALAGDAGLRGTAVPADWPRARAGWYETDPETPGDR
ncbi:DUF501 domain-containing protein [Tsukamurella soli]